MRNTYTGTWTPILVDFIQSDKTAFSLRSPNSNELRNARSAINKALERIQDPPRVAQMGLTLYVIKETH